MTSETINADFLLNESCALIPGWYYDNRGRLWPLGTKSQRAWWEVVRVLARQAAARYVREEHYIGGKMDIVEIARRVWGETSEDVFDANLLRFAELIVEECAKEIERVGPKGAASIVTDGYAGAIRALLSSVDPK